MSKMGKGTFLFIFILLLGFISIAQASELEQIKAQGLIGETATGYIAAVTKPSSEVQQLINKINAERKEHYNKIASMNQTPVGAVEALAGKKAIELTKAGQYVQTKNGQWVKK
jgi:uncharacterized protein YdbL (DUF1318 family)